MCLNIIPLERKMDCFLYIYPIIVLYILAKIFIMPEGYYSVADHVTSAPVVLK